MFSNNYFLFIYATNSFETIFDLKDETGGVDCNSTGIYYVILFNIYRVGSLAK